jgi:hypothetical protein
VNPYADYIPPTPKCPHCGGNAIDCAGNFDITLKHRKRAQGAFYRYRAKENLVHDLANELEEVVYEIQCTKRLGGVPQIARMRRTRLEKTLTRLVKA